MDTQIGRDHARFRKILKGKIKQNLKKYMSNGKLIGKQGKDLVSIPVPQIDLPTFRFGNPGGEVGEKGNSPGDESGEHYPEADVTIEELAELMGEELELPRIQPKARHSIDATVDKYHGMRRCGPAGLRYFKRSYREALKRMMMTGIYNPLRPIIIPIKDDFRYRSWKSVPSPENNAVIFYLMDVSGSMTDERKNLVRMTAFWIDTWLRLHYPKLSCRYLIHDTEAQEVTYDDFYKVTTDGGTRISSVMKLCVGIIRQEYPVADWNIYVLEFSDGENYDDDNTAVCDIIKRSILPAANLFAYGQVGGTNNIGGWSYASSGTYNYMRALQGAFEEEKKVTLVEIKNENGVMPAIKLFLGKGL